MVMAAEGMRGERGSACAPTHHTVLTTNTQSNTHALTLKGTAKHLHVFMCHSLDRHRARNQCHSPGVPVNVFLYSFIHKAHDWSVVSTQIGGLRGLGGGGGRPPAGSMGQQSNKLPASSTR